MSLVGVQSDSVRLRSTLPNGSTIFVEKVVGAKSIAISITANARFCPETPKTNGRRHLLEHLMARGAKSDIDHRLELVGGFLSARTMREAMQFSIVVPPAQVDLGFRTAFDLLATPNPTSERIKTEANIIREELALEESPIKFSNAAWLRSNGMSLSPGGDPEILDATTRDELIKLYRAQFDARNLVLSVVGDVDIDQTMREATKYMQVMPQRDYESVKPLVEPGKTVVPDASGYALGVEVGPVNLPKTIHVLAAGLALASYVDNAYAFFTPSATRSLVIVGTKTDANELRATAKKLDPRILFSRARDLARNWLNAHLDTPEAVADFRGLLACLQVDLRPDLISAALEDMTLDQFTEALARFRPDVCFEVVGR